MTTLYIKKSFFRYVISVRTSTWGMHNIIWLGPNSAWRGLWRKPYKGLVALLTDPEFLAFLNDRYPEGYVLEFKDLPEEQFQYNLHQALK